MTPTNEPDSTPAPTGDSGAPEPINRADYCSVLLIRHGQSEWNALGRWQGQADTPLTQLGRNQAAQAATRINGIDGVWCSDLSRASETARIIADHLTIDDLHVDPRLRERDAGEWSGLTHAQIREQYPGFLDDGRRPDGWEYSDALRTRGLAALVDIAATVGPGGNAIAVTHGGMIYTIEETIDTEGPRIPNLGATEVLLSSDAILLGGRRELLGDDLSTTPDQI